MPPTGLADSRTEAPGHSRARPQRPPSFKCDNSQGRNCTPPLPAPRHPPSPTLGRTPESQNLLEGAPETHEVSWARMTGSRGAQGGGGALLCLGPPGPQRPPSLRSRAVTMPLSGQAPHTLLSSSLGCPEGSGNLAKGGKEPWAHSRALERDPHPGRAGPVPGTLRGTGAIFRNTRQGSHAETKHAEPAAKGAVAASDAPACWGLARGLRAEVLGLGQQPHTQDHTRRHCSVALQSPVLIIVLFPRVKGNSLGRES